MSVGRLLKYQRTKRFDQNTQMWWRGRDVSITSQCKEVTFSLTGEDDADNIEGVETFKYLGSILYQSDKDWPAVLRNVGKAHMICNRLGKLLRRKGGET